MNQHEKLVQKHSVPCPYSFLEPRYKKSRKGAFSEILKFLKFLKCFKNYKNTTFQKLNKYKKRNCTFSFCQYSLIYIPPYIYPYSSQKGLFFWLRLVGFEQVIFQLSARWLWPLSQGFLIKKSKNCTKYPPKLPKLVERNVCNFLNIEIQNMFST